MRSLRCTRLSCLQRTRVRGAADEITSPCNMRTRPCSLDGAARIGNTRARTNRRLGRGDAMMIQGQSVSDEDRRRAPVDRQAGTIISRADRRDDTGDLCRRCCSRRVAPEDIMRYSRANWRRSPRPPGIPAGAHAGRAEDPVRRAAGPTRRGARQDHLDRRDHQRRHAVPGRLGAGRARRRGLDVRLVAHPVFAVERDTPAR